MYIYRTCTQAPCPACIPLHLPQWQQARHIGSRKIASGPMDRYVWFHTGVCDNCRHKTVARNYTWFWQWLSCQSRQLLSSGIVQIWQDCKILLGLVLPSILANNRFTLWVATLENFQLTILRKSHANWTFFKMHTRVQTFFWLRVYICYSRLNTATVSRGCIESTQANEIIKSKKIFKKQAFWQFPQTGTEVHSIENLRPPKTF